MVKWRNGGIIKLDIYRPVSHEFRTADEVLDGFIANLGIVLRNVFDLSQLGQTADSYKFFNKRLLMRYV